MNKTKFAICIPTYNRADLLIPALMYYAVDFPNTDIFIWDNGDNLRKVFDYKSINSIRKITNNNKCKWIIGRGHSVNIGVAGAWNRLLRKVFALNAGVYNDLSFDTYLQDREYTHAIVLNDDIYWGQKEYSFVPFINHAPDHLLNFACYGEAGGGFSVFMISKTCFKAIGEFDERYYPAYYEDCDYKMRLFESGMVDMKTAMRMPMFNPVIFNKSMTLEKEPTLVDGYKEKNKALFLNKWGHMEKHFSELYINI
jgi:GT2 family glycosyltransferase